LTRKNATRSAMKSPADLAARWTRQWELPDNRVQRLLNPDAWPLSLPVPKPTSVQFSNETSRVREHIRRWRSVSVGRVVWQAVSFRGGSEPVEIPVAWELNTPSEWAVVTADAAIMRRLDRLARLWDTIPAQFHHLMARQPHLLEDKNHADVVKATEVALGLTPGCAQGRPLRAVSVGGIDTKFLERHRNLIVQLLDVVYDGQVSELGLETFLGALDESDHWLLLAPLCADLLPFTQQRVRASELRSTPLRGSHILIVENERSLHQLPQLNDTTAVLGAGLNLEWMDAPWLRAMRLGYWGDLDTWGLQMLAAARRRGPGLTPILMTREVFEKFGPACAVAEPVQAAETAPDYLCEDETALYRYLRAAERGRLEQEFLPAGTVGDAVLSWRYGAAGA
ncbi:MAG: Wadjet anti-phage system protein JetD domain-containing protein, partial [Gammaproteobacteria bacterium]